jgi:hypothetical protein
LFGRSFLPFLHFAAFDHHIMRVVLSLNLDLAKFHQSCLHISMFRWFELRQETVILRLRGALILSCWSAIALSFCVRMKSYRVFSNLNRRPGAQSKDKRAPAVRNDPISNMKAFFSIILALAVAVGTAEAGPVKRAAYVAKTTAKTTAKTAKNVAHNVVRGTRRVVDTVVEAVTQ